MDAGLRTEAAELRLGIALRTGPADGIAGMIEFEKEERQARSTGARQSYQPAGGLFERNIEARAQDLDIIASPLRGREERAIQDHQGMRGIERQVDAGDTPGLAVRGREVIEDRKKSHTGQDEGVGVGHGGG